MTNPGTMTKGTKMDMLEKCYTYITGKGKYTVVEWETEDNHLYFDFVRHYTITIFFHTQNKAGK